MVKLGSKEYYVWPWRVLVVLLIFLPNQSLHGDHIDSIQAEPFEIFLKKSSRLATFFNLFLVSSQKMSTEPKSGQNRHLGPKREKKRANFFISSAS